MTDPSSASLEQHLKDERAAYAGLALLNIQMSSLLDRFYREWLALDLKRQQLTDELEHHSLIIREHRRRLELTLFPAEFRMWLNAAAPELATPTECGVVEEAPYEPFGDTLCTTSFSPTGEKRAVFDDTIARQVVRWRAEDGGAPVWKERPAPARLVRVAPQPACLLRLCFVPYRETQTAELRRRAVERDVVVMRSPEPSMGRVLVSMREVRRGESIMLETPLFTSPTGKSEADDERLLPPVVREAMGLVLRQSAVFAAQGWDARLLRPFYYWLAELAFGENSREFSRQWAELGCPLEDVEPSCLSKLSDLAHFLWMSLPSSLFSVVGTEEQLLMFFVTLLTNGIGYGGTMFAENDPHDTVVDNFHCSFLETGIAVFGGLSLIEHNCHPNAVVVFCRGCTPESVVFAELRATRAIAIGERITIAYVPVFFPREERQRRLRAKFFFQCDCDHCSGGSDTTRLMFVSTGSLDEEVVMCPKGRGSEWVVLGSWVSGSSAEDLKGLGKHYRFDDPHVLEAVRDEVAFRQEADAVDLSGGDDAMVGVLTAEVRRLADILHRECKSLVTPLHHLFLLRSLQVAAVTRSRCSCLSATVVHTVVSFLFELLNALTSRVFALPQWFMTELLLGGAQTGVLTDDLRERLLDNGNRKSGVTQEPWQGKIAVRSLLYPHASLVVSHWEHYAALCEETRDKKGAVNAWTACVMLLRYGMCQGSSERCLRAQLRALQCRQQS